MSNLMSRIRRHRTAIVISLLRLGVYASLMFVFFLFMSVNNWPLRHISRTLATTLLTYLVITVAMTYVYGGYDVGRKKSKPVISAMIFSSVFIDLVTYLQLQIMNVNSQKNDHLQLFGPDLLMLGAAFLCQILLIIFWVRLGNMIYFSMNKPRSCLLVLNDLSQENALSRKISRYALQWRLDRVILSDDPDLKEAIRKAEVIFLGDLPDEVQANLLRMCYDEHRDVMCKAQLPDILLSNARQAIVDDAPFLEICYGRITIGQRIVKRSSDILISLIVLIVLSPLLAVISLCVRLEDGGPVIFRQKRMTVAGHEFTIRKFRTMTVASSESEHQVSARSGDRRITKIGRFLRRFRLDELPQFFNILIGDMTLVGPRPEMLENVQKYKLELPAFVYREKMKAGLTGFAQIEGKYNTTPEDKLMLDLMYIESFSIWLDVKLILRTFTVLTKSDSTEGFTDDDLKKEA